MYVRWCLPVDSGTIYKARKHHQPSAKKLGDRTKAKNNMKVIADSLNKERPHGILSFHYPCKFGTGTNAIKYLWQVILGEQIRYLHHPV